MKTKISLRSAVSAVVIAGTQEPLRLGENYKIESLDQTATGRIDSIVQRLASPLIASSPESLLQPREMAHVTIEIAELPNVFGEGVRRFALVEPATGKTMGDGLVIPNQDPSRRDANLHGLTVWLTGLSGAGKTTIARRVQDRLQRGCAVEVLDADIARTYLCKDLGYAKEDRDENVRRLGFVANLLTRNGLVVLVTAIAPYRAARDSVRQTINNFIEVYVNAPIAVCEQRDVKGLYRRARAGEVRLFTGIEDPYEAPLAPEVECRTDLEDVSLSVSRVIAAIEKKLGKSLLATHG